MNDKTTGKKQSLTKEQLLEFCLLFKSLGDAKETARRMGLNDPEMSGLKLIHSKKVRKMLSKLESPCSAYEIVKAGLERLAFGSITDAVKLLQEDCNYDSAKLDLYNVSEIKRVKGGGMEIKFFDRLEALEKLLQIEESYSRTATAQSFFTALDKSAKLDLDADSQEGDEV